MVSSSLSTERVGSRYAFTAVVLVVLSAAAVYALLYWPHPKTGSGLLGFCLSMLFFLWLDYCNKFKGFRRFLEKTWWDRGGVVWGSISIVLMLVDFVLLTMSQSNDPHRVIKGTDIFTVTTILTWLAITCVALTVLCTWDALTFYIVENPLVESVILLIPGGFLVLEWCRWIRPPPDYGRDHLDWSWHVRHDLNDVLSGICSLTAFLFVLIVVMGALGMAAFAEFSKSSAEGLGTLTAIGIFCGIAVIVMISPLFPGAIVDACGGYLVVFLLWEKEGYEVWVSFLLALALIVVLHFIGSCLQWCLGLLPCVQTWANATLPVTMLAASDSALRGAGCIKTGIVGQVFMDTANGLNQGRMHLPFCTQFWSEYSSMPSAVSLVALGTVLVVSKSGSYEWTSTALPLVLMVAALWQGIGGLLGGRELAKSTDSREFWVAREKWSTMQFFIKQGYTPTKQGWKQDVYEVAALIQKVEVLHQIYVSDSVTARNASVRQRAKKHYSVSLDKTREAHWNLMLDGLSGKAKEGLLVFEERAPPTKSIWHDAHLSKTKRALQIFLVLCMVGFGAGAWYKISRPVELQQAVQHGFQAISGGVIGWGCFVMFFVSQMLYSCKEFMAGVVGLGSALLFVGTCCRSKVPNANLKETEFFSHEAWLAVTGHIDVELSQGSFKLATDDGHQIHKTFDV